MEQKYAVCAQTQANIVFFYSWPSLVTFDYKYGVDICQTMSESNMMLNESPETDQMNLQKFKQTAIRRLIRILDRRLLPYMFFIEIASCIDRINTGRIASMNSIGF